MSTGYYSKKGEFSVRVTLLPMFSSNALRLKMYILTPDRHISDGASGTSLTYDFNQHFPSGRTGASYVLCFFWCT